MDVRRFKRDHAAVLAAVTELRTLVKNGVKENAAAISKTVVAMRSAIKLHLAAEDRSSNSCKAPTRQREFPAR